MKLSELSFREYIALEALPAIISATAAGQHNPGAMLLGDNSSGATLEDRMCFDAFHMADAFLKRAGREHDKVAEIKRECDKLEAQVSLLLNMNEDGNFSARVALLQIWEFLGVTDQTAAMQALRDLHAGIKTCLDAERARQADLKPGAPASQYTAARIEKLERLLP